MRIAYECTTARAGASGIGRMAERLAYALEAELGAGLVVLTNAEAPAGLRAAPRVGPLRPTPLWMQAAVPRLARRERFDLFHFTNSTAPVALGAPYVTTIHDLSLVRLPETHPWRRKLYQRTLLERSARRARRVLTISHASAHDVVELLGVPEERVAVTPLAADERFRPAHPADVAAARARHDLAGPYVLYVGNVEPRKNLVNLVEAFERASAEGVTLAIAGGLAWLSGEIERRVGAYRGPGRVRLLGYVPDADLPALYTGAEAFAYVSLWEGFGLPVLEAMACGTPVVASRIPALEEVAGGAAVLVDPLDPDAIADALRGVLENSGRRAEIARAGLARAASFSWAETARRTVEVYRAAIAAG